VKRGRPRHSALADRPPTLLSTMFTAITDANAEILEQNTQGRVAVEELAQSPGRVRQAVPAAWP